ncbi:vesicle transport through interaction with t-SNAREs homolog 1A-like [Anneissia japonica]|uniref:vesicle transport through interaction with t-SNAREs homolog 1A-like n=1 Tax=Anneissia japonica TaxID=1529436 RepID=UPI0014259893|nr:vesicle transport through interaction with t-SNAREs homolog 1A-like [Anneissia japonica]
MMSDMTAMEEFEHQFASLSADITSKINDIPKKHGNEKKILVNTAEKQMDEAQELLEQMDLEVRGIPAKDRQKYSTRVKSYQTELTRLEKDLRRSKIAFTDLETGRDELFGLEDVQSSEDQRTRLLDNTERLERSGRKLEAGYRMTVETEQIGQDILDNLHRDREKINNSRQRLRDMDSTIGQSSRVLNTMLRRIIQNRFLMIFLGLVVVAVIILAIFFSVKKHK